MSHPFSTIEPLVNLHWVPLALTVLTMGLAGSLHCAAMCGPLLGCGIPKNHQVAYHFGRLISYSTLGGATGWIGSSLFEHLFPWLAWFGLGVISMMLFLVVAETWVGKIGFGARLAAIMTPWVRHWKSKPVLFGLVTPLLPCGWLLGFLILSTLIASPAKSAMVMGVFSISSIPALSATVWGANRVSKYRWSKWVRLGLVLLSFALLAGRLSQVSQFQKSLLTCQSQSFNCH